jgi:hypothetical protein
MPERFRPRQSEERSESDSKEKGEGRRLLHELEATGKYVFHGTATADIDELQVLQPHDWKDGTKKEHGPPSVAASPYADIAIFRSLIYQDWTDFGVENGVCRFSASKKALDNAKGNEGYIYVLDKAGFSPFEGGIHGMDWRSPEPQRPVRVVKVTFVDLPEGIGLIRSPHRRHGRE